ncbi:MAG: hypothetical protein V3V05_12850 [Pontiella sp.]
MRNQANTMEHLSIEYQEESIKPAIIVMLVAVVIVSLPLGWMIHKISDQGVRIADVSRYQNLALLVDSNVSTIRKILANDVVDDRVLSGVAAAPLVTLITPNISPTNRDEAAHSNTKNLDVELKAIYWSPRDPLVTLGDENYRVGEKIQGFTIAEIRKTEVVFKSPLGDTVVKYFYDYLDTPKRK